MPKYPSRIDPKFVATYKDRTPPWGPVGYITYKRTYSRFRDDLGRREEWYETIERCINGLLYVGGVFTDAELRRLFDHVYSLRCSFGGRSLWQLGTDTVDRLGGDSLQNCWLVVANDPIKPITFTFNQLMLGGGVGFNIQPENVYEMPKVRFNIKVERVDTSDCDYIVPDNREGWVRLLKLILTAYFYTGKDFTYNTKCIRSRGVPIKSFGGTASGSEDLVAGIKNICAVLARRHNQKLRPVDVLDIENIIGSIVVAGNVRRSAEIGIGDAGDLEFLHAKDWSSIAVPPWRAMSNNTVACERINDLSEDFWRGYQGNGEAYGLINLDNCRSYGRLHDGRNPGVDALVMGTNPCGEITLEAFEPCNLGELFLPNIPDLKHLGDVSELMLRVLKTISCVKFSDPDTQAVVDKNHRLGLGITGWMHNHPFRDEMADLYGHLRTVDVEYSKLLKVDPSIKITTVKPSGTLSLLAGVTPGVHPAYAPYYNRLIRFSSNDPLVNLCREHGYYVEPEIRLDGSRNFEVSVVYFPIKTDSGVQLANQVSGVDQLQEQHLLQSTWSDNAVSCTCYFHPHELPAIRGWLDENYAGGVKSTSFLLHSGHGFVQAPLQEITENQYLEYSANTRPIVRSEEGNHTFEIDPQECVGGSCPVK